MAWRVSFFTRPLTHIDVADAGDARRRVAGALARRQATGRPEHVTAVARAVDARRVAARRSPAAGLDDAEVRAEIGARAARDVGDHAHAHDERERDENAETTDDDIA